MFGRSRWTVLLVFANIDGQLRCDHVEYADRLAHYEELDDFAGLPVDLHGAAMASLLVGRSIGVAPGAALHHFALDFARLTPERLAAAIERDVFVLVSVYPLDHVDPPLAIRGLGCSPWRDRGRPEAFGASPGEVAAWRTAGESVSDVWARRAASELGYASVNAPAHHRPVGGHEHAGHYRYDVEGGDSEWPPYLTGVLAMALQVAPDPHASDLAGLLADGAVHGPGLIAPTRVVALARAGVPRP